MTTPRSVRGIQREWWEDYFDDYVGKILFEEARIKEAEEDTPRLIEWLSLKPGDRLMDLACGVGRFAIPLARQGIRVHGVDISEAYLETARRKAFSEGLELSFAREDMRRIRFVSEFDAVINMFTSFGYFEKDEDHFRTMVRIARALKPGGRFLIDVINRDIIIKNFRPREWSRSGDFLVLEDREFDYERSRMITRWIICRLCKKDEVPQVWVEKVFSLRLFSPSELCALIERAGLRVVRVAATLDGGPVSPSEPRMVVLATKPVTKSRRRTKSVRRG